MTGDTAFIYGGKGYVDIRILDNYAIGAEGEFLKMQDKLDELEDAYYENNYPYTKEAWNTYIANKVKVLNDNAKYILVSNKDKSKIADAKFISVLDSRGEAEEVLILVFADGTEATVQAYFGAGFESVVSAWEAFIAKFNKK